MRYAIIVCLLVLGSIFAVDSAHADVRNITYIPDECAGLTIDQCMWGGYGTGIFGALPKRDCSKIKVTNISTCSDLCECKRYNLDTDCKGGAECLIYSARGETVCKAYCVTDWNE